jgi:hypothetical protein
VDVDRAGEDQEPGRIDDLDLVLRRESRQVADRFDRLAADEDVGRARPRSGDDRPAADEQVAQRRVPPPRFRFRYAYMRTTITTIAMTMPPP